MAADEREDFREMELWEHLAELRSRLIRSASYLLVGVIIGWIAFDALWTVLFAPLEPQLKRVGGQVIFTNFTDPFVLRLQVAIIAGIAIALPFITMELWGFVSPGLTRNERKVCRIIFPMSVCFFMLGIVVGYSVMTPSVQWFLKLLPPDTQLLQQPNQYMTFMARMILAFGVTFQLPLVLMALCYIGLIQSRTLVEQWRFAVVGCVILGAVTTPGGDPFSMMLMAVPLAVLYGASIFFCRWVERFKERQERLEAERSHTLATAAGE